MGSAGGGVGDGGAVSEGGRGELHVREIPAGGTGGLWGQRERERET